MSEKRKISIRKILQALVTLVLAGGCVFAMLSASSLQNKERISELNIRIKNDRFRFIDTTEVKKMLLSDRSIDVNKACMGKLNIYQMEKIVSTNPWVADAQVYIDNRKVLNVNITQRIPVARIFDQAGNSYYLDHTLQEMPLSDKYVHYTTVVTNVPVLNTDSSKNALRGQIVALVRYIDRDTFWSAQVSQVIVCDDLGFELVPVLGSQKILFGDTSNMESKFRNLFVFYKSVLNRVGWDKYSVLDLRYKTQVVATPAIAWKAPVDKAMSDMSWVKSIIGNDTGAKEFTAVSKPVVQRQIKPEPVAKPIVVKKQDPLPAKQPAPVKQSVPVKVPATHNAVVAKPKAKPVEKLNKKKIETKAKDTKGKKESKTPKYIYNGQ